MFFLTILIFLYVFFFRYAYLEFEDTEGVENAKLLSDSLLRGRQIKVYIYLYFCFIIIFRSFLKELISLSKGKEGREDLDLEVFSRLLFFLLKLLY